MRAAAEFFYSACTTELQIQESSGGSGGAAMCVCGGLQFRCASLVASGIAASTPRPPTRVRGESSPQLHTGSVLDSRRLNSVIQGYLKILPPNWGDVTVWPRATCKTRNFRRLSIRAAALRSPLPLHEALEAI